MPRRRRAKKTGTMSNFVKARLTGILFIAMASVIFGAIALFNELVPSTYIVVGEGGIYVMSRPVADAYGLDVKVIATLLGAAAGIFTMVSGIRRLGVKV
ncbi:MAG: hypothetical protein QXX12_08110 [Nanopusillaceae archaeon]